jgi:hypothetical protein
MLQLSSAILNLSVLGYQLQTVCVLQVEPICSNPLGQCLSAGGPQTYPQGFRKNFKIKYVLKFFIRLTFLSWDQTKMFFSPLHQYFIAHLQYKNKVSSKYNLLEDFF